VSRKVLGFLRSSLSTQREEGSVWKTGGSSPAMSYREHDTWAGLAVGARDRCLAMECWEKKDFRGRAVGECRVLSAVWVF